MGGRLRVLPSLPKLAVALLACALPMAALAQEDGDLRLQNGAVEHEGRLEVYGQGAWGTVCDDGWLADENGDNNGDVACRQLGYAGGVYQVRPHAHFGQGSGSILLDDVHCSGSESRLIDCQHRGLGGFHNCSHSEDVGVTCWNPTAEVSQDTLSVAEGDAAGSRYDIVLVQQPTADVTVTVGGTDGTDVTASPTALTYTTANWDEAQTVTVTAADDADAVDDTVTLVHSASGGGYDDATIGDVVVTVYDDEGANAAPSFDEGVSTTRSVAENTPSGNSVGAPVSATDADDDPLTYSLAGADAAHFAIVATSGQLQTSGALDHEQGVVYRVTVKVEDDAGRDDTIAVGISVGDVDEPPAAPSRLRVQSRTSTEMTLTWNAPSASDRPAAQSYDLQYRLEGAATFTTGPEDVTSTSALITGLAPGTTYEVQVRATNDEGTGAWSASAMLRTDYAAGEHGELALRDGASDNEGRLEIFANGSWGTVCDDGWGHPPAYDDGRPNAEVACRQLGFRRALELHHASRFTAGTGPIHLDNVWCEGTESRLIDCTHRGIGNTGGCSHSDDVELICDASQPPSVSVSPQALTVAEGDAEGGQYGIVLGAAPSANVVVTVEGTSGTDVTASPSSLTYTTVDWDQTQTVTVTAAHDTDSEDDPVTLSHSASGGGYDDVSIADVVVTVTDDDAANQAPVFSEGATTTRTVAENSPPGHFIGAPVSATDTGGGTLTYSLAGGDTSAFDIVASSGQLRVNGALDHEQSASHQVTVKVEDDESASDTINVTIGVSDVDEPPSAPGPPAVSGVTNSIAKLRWEAPADSGRPAVLHYDLQYRAAGDAAFTAGPQGVLDTNATLGGLAPSTDYEVQVRADNGEGVSAWSTSATFRTIPANGALRLVGPAIGQGRVEVVLDGSWRGVCNDNWGTNANNGRIACQQLGFPDVARVWPGGSFGNRGPPWMNGVACDGTESRLIDCPHTLDDLGYTCPNAGVTCLFGSLRVSPDTLPIAEGDAEGGQYQIELSTEPSAAVVVTISGTAGTDVTASPSTLTYTVADWNTTRTVTVTAAEDDDMEDDRVTLTHTATGGGYDRGSNPTVEVTVTDDDGANPAPSFDEGASTSRDIAENTPAGAAIGAPVSATDTDPLTYSLGGADAAHFAIQAADGQLLTKGALDYERRTGYDVTVRVEDDNGGADTIAVTIAVTDVDEPPSAPARPRVTATTANSATFAWDPPGDSDRPPVDDYDLQYRAGTTGAFTAGPQSVTGMSATITGLVPLTTYQVQVRASNAEGAGAWSPSATILFDPGVRGDLRLVGGTDRGEGRVEVFVNAWGTVCDDDWDARDGRVACRQAGFVDATAVHGSAHFGEGVGPINLDDVNCDGTESRLIDCPHTASGLSNCDHSEDAGVTCLTAPTGWVTPAEFTVVEADTDGGQYEIGLDYQPVGDTVVTVGGTSATDVTASPSTLTFTVADWDQAQTVTVTAADDADMQDDFVTLVHAATGGGYQGGIPNVEVTVTDDDGANTPPSFDEGVATTRNVAENSSAGSLIGSPVSATDADDDPLTYSLLGVDAAHFGLDAASGQLLVDGDLDHEQGITYRVTVEVEDDAGDSDTINVAIDVDDVDEPPLAPSAPSIVSTSDTSLTLRWEPPPNSDRPAIDDYDLQHRVGDTGAFTAGPEGVVQTRATITGLTQDTEYEVQVRANNDEGQGAWSPSASLRTDPPPSSDATLKGLTVHDGDGDAALTPAFDPAVTAYTVQVTGTVTRVSIHAERSHAGSTVTPTPDDLDPDTAGIQMRLALGDNVMTLDIVSEDGSTETYTITVNRGAYCTAESPAVTGVTSSPSDALVNDCNVLMAWREGVIGEDPPALNWSPDRSMRNWNAIRVSGGRVTELNSWLGGGLFSHSLEGELTPELGTLSALTVLRLQSVGLMGPIPPEIGNLSQLTVLDFGDNSTRFIGGSEGLSGPIPDSLGNLTALTTLDLSANRLSGQIPDSLQRLTSLRKLRLAENVKTDVFNVPFAGTGFTGYLPDWLPSLTGLTELTLDYNLLDGHLDGRVVRGLGELPDLVELTLEWNYLRGCVPGPLIRFRGDIATQRQRGTVNHGKTFGNCPRPGRTTATVTSAIGGEIVVAYRASVQLGAEPIRRFEYRLSTDGGATWHEDWTAIPNSGRFAVNSSSYAFGGLENGTEYTISLRAVNADGAGGPGEVTATPRAQSSDATLAALEVAETATGRSVAVSPAFDPATRDYEATVQRSVATVSVFAVPTDTNASVSSQPGDHDAGRRGIQVPLDTGFNEVALTITAEDGVTQRVYQLSVLREQTNASAGVEVDPPALTLEEGQTGSYTVKLTGEPVEAVTVAVNASGIGEVTTSPSRLTFPTYAWSTAQTVEVTAQADDDSVDGHSVLSHTATGAGYERVTVPDVAVDVVDDDIDAVVVSTPTLTVTEGSRATYTVVLATEPVGSVAVTATAPSGAGLAASPGSLVFTSTNWATAQTVTVEAEHDADGEDDAATVTHTVSGGGYDGVSVDSVRMTVLDDDTKAVVVSTTELNIPEHGSAAYTLVLDTEPTGPVSVTAMAPPGSDLSVAPSVLTFSPTDWMTAQGLTVSVSGDADAEDETATVTHVASGGGYGAVAVPGVVVAVEDGDTPEVIFSTTALGVAENAEASYTVRLASVPRSTVTIVPTAPATSDLSVSPAEVVFTTADWQSARSVTVSAGDDSDTANDEDTVSHAATGAGYDGVSLASVNVTVTDDDTPGVVVWATKLEVREGGSVTYNVRLATQPSASVTVTATATGDGGVEVDPTVLTFTATDWATAKIVTVRAAQDDDTENAQYTVRHAVRGGDYDGITAPDTEITVTDDDIAGATLSAASIAVVEGASATYTVVLDTAPSGPVTVAPAVLAGASVTVRPRALTFTATDWRAAQTVTVDALEDDDGEGATENVSHTASGGGYDGVALASVAVVVEDDDAIAVTLSTTALSVREGGAETYTVSLATEPTGEVTVTPSTPVGADLRLSPAGLVFDAVNWGTAQVVTVHADHDDDTAADQATVSHVASGGGYGGVAIDNVSVGVVDDDRAGVVLSTALLTIAEGDRASYTLRLVAEPPSSVIVTARVASGSGIELDTSSLTFAIDDWHLERTVTVDAAEDADADDGTATIAHAARGGDYDGVQVASLVVAVLDDDSAPMPVDARARIDRLTLRFDRMLDESSIPDPEAFAVQADPNGRVDVAAVAVASDTVVLTLARAVQPGEHVTVTYTPGNRLIRSAGRIAARGFTMRVSLPAPAGEESASRVLLFESASNADRQGFVRVINHAGVAGEVNIEAVDDNGMRVGPVALGIAVGGAVHFNSDDLEHGNMAKGLADGVGPPGLGNWRLQLTSDLDIEVLSYARTSDGFVTSLHDTVPVEAGVHRGLVFFNPGDNPNQESWLRLVNAGDVDAGVTVTGTDDRGTASGEVSIHLPAGTSIDLAASELESGVGQGIEGGNLGDGEGKWRLAVVSDAPIAAMSLLVSEGRLTNLSTAPQTPGSTEGSIAVLLFPSMSNPDLQGFVRVINHSAQAGEVRINAFDDTDRTYETLTLSINAGAAAQFNSDDLELGNPDKGLVGSTGAGMGAWRLELDSDLDIEVLGYIRTDDGFVTAMHDLAPIDDDVHRVVFLNPASNVNQVSRLRLVNPGETDAAVTLTGIDSDGISPGGPVQATVPAGTSLELTSAELESGDSEDIEGGAFGDGAGKWLVRIESDQPIHVMSLLRSPTGHLTNLSTSPYDPGSADSP